MKVEKLWELCQISKPVLWGYGVEAAGLSIGGQPQPEWRPPPLVVFCVLRAPEKSRHWTTVVVGALVTMTSWVMWVCYLSWWSCCGPQDLILLCLLVLWLRSKGDFWQLPTCDNPSFSTPTHLSHIATHFSEKTHRSKMSGTAENSPMYSPFFGVMGATSAMVFSGKQILLFSVYLSEAAVFDK